jgi:hypothetical protein
MPPWTTGTVFNQKLVGAIHAMKWARERRGIAELTLDAQSPGELCIERHTV